MARTHGRAAFAFVFVTVLLDMLALGVVVPVLPRLVVEMRGGDTASGAQIFGLFASVWAAMQFLFSPVLGSLSDRYGRRRVILLSNVGLGLDYVLMAAAPTIGWLFAGRVLSGITSSSFSAASAYVADVTPPEERAAKFGMLGAAFGVGFVVGPSLGGLLAGVSIRAPFWASAALSLANAVYGFFILPESLSAERRSPFRWGAANPLGSLQLLRSHPELLGLALTFFLYMLAHDSMPSTFVLYTTYRYRWDEQTIGLVLALVGIASMIVQALLVGRLVAALGERRALATGLLTGAAGMVVYGLAPSGAVFLIGIPLTAMFGLTNPSLQSLMTRRVDPTAQGQLQGANGSIMGIAAMIAPLAFTQIFAASVSARGAACPGLPFLVAAGLLVVAVLISSRRADRVAAPAGEMSPEA